MHSLASNVIHLLLLTTFLALFQIPSKAEDPIIITCFNSSNYTNGSQFQANLNSLFASLYTNVPPTRFNTTISGEDPDRVYGLVQCKGDSSEENCRKCVNTSSVEIVRLCPNRKEAAIRFEHCVLRYSDSRFFSQVENTLRIWAWPVQNASDPLLFKEKLNGLMDNLSSTAASSPSKFATETTSFGYFQKIYGLLQCTRDLSNENCYSCLQGIIGDIPKCCNGMTGGNVLAVSCNLRYEIYPFFEFSEPPPPSPVEVPPPPSPVEALLPPPGLDNDQDTSTSNLTSENNSRIVVIVVIPVVIALVLASAICTFLLRRKSIRKEDGGGDVEITKSGDSFLIDLRTLKVATGNFSDSNKLGEGGFGSVYKGKLLNGCEIAVKRLSRSSTQGTEELRTEIRLLAKLEHRNLVRLLGCCIEEQEKLLVYEYLPNSSLDRFLFDRIKRLRLDWEKRYNIIAGIARGLLYLHQDSQLRIIHRDLKASNILLDENMNPKISDFGLARHFCESQTRGNTNRIAGTYGYMPPEYVNHGRFSTKSDIFSFGVLVLEIVTGRKNSSFRNSECVANLLSYAWQHWKNGTPFDMLDQTLDKCCSRSEVLRCIQIGLLCVQKDAADRPTMSAIVLLLNSYTVTLPVPSEPAFFVRSHRTRSDELERDMGATESDQSTTKSKTQSINDVTISELDPR